MNPVDRATSDRLETLRRAAARDPRVRWIEAGPTAADRERVRQAKIRRRALAVAISVAVFTVALAFLAVH